ncbi:MAG: DUF6174 domain-containing protein [Dehalococcoidia bacterium]|jgi:hypothetical protein|nr:DUF6174 domain-containing protein [Dehalococcoidia bacterium]
MNRITTLAVLAGALAIALTACSSDSEPTATLEPTAFPTATFAAIDRARDPAALDVVPENVEIDRKTAMLLGIDLHRQLWATRPSDNYKFGFQWNVGEYAYQRANVEVRIIKGEVDEVLWANDAVKTDGTEPAGFVVPDKPNADEYYSIDGLFIVIEEAMDSDPANVSLGFDSAFGFPTSVFIEFDPASDRKAVSFFAAQLSPIAGPPQ